MCTYLLLLYVGRHCTLSFTASYSLFTMYFADPSSAASINGFFSLASGLARQALHVHMRAKHLDYVLLTVWKCSVMPSVMLSLYILRRTIFMWGHIRIFKASVKFMCSERSSWLCFYMQPDFYSGHISCHHHQRNVYYQDCLSITLICLSLSWDLYSLRGLVYWVFEVSRLGLGSV